MNDNNTVTANNNNTENAMRGNLFIGPEFVLVIGIVGLAANELYKLVVKFL